MQFHPRLRCNLRGGLLAIALLVLGAAPSLGVEADSELESLLARFDEVQESIRTLSAEFTETTRSILLKEEIVATGKVFLTKPDAVRWEYVTPEEMRFVIADDTYTGYFPLRNQAEKRDVHRWGEQLFRFLGIGQASGELAKFYKIRMEKSDETREGEVLLVLDPKKRRVRKRMESVRFWISEETLLPTRIRYSSRAGNIREIEFVRMIVNPEIEPSLYVMDLPESVEITKGFSALSGFGRSGSSESTTD